jgi:hypothetical protein
MSRLFDGSLRCPIEDNQKFTRSRLDANEH